MGERLGKCGAGRRLDGLAVRLCQTLWRSNALMGHGGERTDRTDRHQRPQRAEKAERGQRKHQACQHQRPLPPALHRTDTVAAGLSERYGERATYAVRGPVRGIWGDFGGEGEGGGAVRTERGADDVLRAFVGSWAQWGG